jgi:adenylate cyclase
MDNPQALGSDFFRRRGWLRRIVISLLVACLALAAAVALPRDNVIEGWQTDIVSALRVAIFGTKPLASEHVLIVTMDARSLDSPELIGRPRALFTPVYEAIAQKAFAHDARGLLLDVILAYDARGLKIGETSPLKGYDTPFLKLLRAERKTGRMVLGWSADLLPARRFLQVGGKDALGLTVIPLGAGNVIRDVPPSVQDLSGEMQPTLLGRALTLLGQERTEPVKLIPPGPIDGLSSVALIDLLRCENSNELQTLLEGRVIFLGGTLPGEDRVKTTDRLMPRADLPETTNAGDSAACEFIPPDVRGAQEQSIPGVYAHGAAADAVASGWMPEIAPDWMSYLAATVAAFVAAMAAMMIRPPLGGAFMGLMILLVLAVAVVALEGGVWVPLSGATLATPAAFVLAWGVRLRLVDRREIAIRRDFGRYLSPILVQQMIEAGYRPELGGQERNVTVIFADLSGFTTTSETMESAELTVILNRYLDRIAGVVRDNQGYVDKFIGDAVMAIWNAPAEVPEHELAAVRAAHLIEAAVAELARADCAEGKHAFEIKIGISSGPATVGNIGAQDRMNYTVVGETVNLASRFESLPSLFRVPIIMGPGTAKAVADHYCLLPVVSIRVKGKSKGVQIFTPLCKVQDSRPETTALIGEYATALRAFEDADFITAAEIWQDLSDRNWRGAGPAQTMAEEASALARRSLVEPWDGTMEAESR